MCIRDRLSIEKRLSPIPDSTSLRNVSGFLLAIVRSIRAPSEKPIASTGGSANGVEYRLVTLLVGHFICSVITGPMSGKICHDRLPVSILY